MRASPSDPGLTGSSRGGLDPGTDRTPRGVDVRLAGGAAVAWLTLAVCLGRSVAVVLGAAAAGAGLGVLGLRRAGERSAGRSLSVAARLVPAVAATGFCVALVLLSYAGRLWQARAAPLSALARQHADVTAELTVSADPRPLAPTGVAGVPRVAVGTTASEFDAAGQRWRLRAPVLVLAPATGWRAVLPGQRVRIEGTLQPSLDRGSTGATLFAERPPRLIGRPPWWQRAAGRVRAALRRAAGPLPSEERGLLPGLVDGDTSGLDPVLADRFRVAGLTHLVAVSGTNCSIVVGAVLLVLRRARVRPALCAATGGAVLIAFVLVARPTPSVLRAALMAAIVLVSLATGRPRQAVPALAAATLGLLVWNPQLAVDPGFTMSVVASAALLLIAPGWASALRRRRVPAGVAEAVAVAAAAHLVTAPVIAAMTGRVSVVAIPANVLAEPAVPVATLLGFGTALVAPLWLPGGRLLAELAGWPCRWLVGVADLAGGLPGARLVWPGGTLGGAGLVVASAGVVLLARRAGVLRVLVAGGLIGALVQIPVRSFATGWPPHGWVMVACDVGQGDALVLSAGPHTAVEIDAGPDPVAIDRCLRGLGVTDVALLVFSHYHLDHVGGIAGVLHDRRVEHVLTGPLAEPASGVALVRTALSARHLTVSTPAVGTRFSIGQVQLEVLAPPAAFTGTRSDPNNSSLVLRATVGDVRILLPGDVELEAQQAMLTDHVDVTADVLKVPHHGSAYSDPAFLAAVHARVAVISVGLHNDYGHPSPLLLADLQRLDLPARRTDDDGDVAVLGPLARLATVLRTPAASSAALAPAGPESARAPAAAPARAPLSASAPDARMSTWLPRPPAASRPTSCPTRCRGRCCSSATRSFSSPARSARSPPRPGAPIPT